MSSNKKFLQLDSCILKSVQTDFDPKSLWTSPFSASSRSIDAARSLEEDGGLFNLLKCVMIASSYRDCMMEHDPDEYTDMTPAVRLTDCVGVMLSLVDEQYQTTADVQYYFSENLKELPTVCYNNSHFTIPHVLKLFTATCMGSSNPERFKLDLQEVNLNVQFSQILAGFKVEDELLNNALTFKYLPDNLYKTPFETAFREVGKICVVKSLKPGMTSIRHIPLKVVPKFPILSNYVVDDDVIADQILRSRGITIYDDDGMCIFERVCDEDAIAPGLHIRLPMSFDELINQYDERFFLGKRIYWVGHSRYEFLIENCENGFTAEQVTLLFDFNRFFLKRILFLMMKLPAMAYMYARAFTAKSITQYYNDVFLDAVVVSDEMADLFLSMFPVCYKFADALRVLTVTTNLRAIGFEFEHRRDARMTVEGVYNAAITLATKGQCTRCDCDNYLNHVDVNEVIIIDKASEINDFHIALDDAMNDVEYLDNDETNIAFNHNYDVYRSNPLSVDNQSELFDYGYVSVDGCIDMGMFSIECIGYVNYKSAKYSKFRNDFFNICDGGEGEIEDINKKVRIDEGVRYKFEIKRSNIIVVRNGYHMIYKRPYWDLYDISDVFMIPVSKLMAMFECSDDYIRWLLAINDVDEKF